MTLPLEVRKALNEALGWDGNLVRRVAPVVERLLAEERARALGRCGCAWCCHGVPPERRGETHRRTCLP